MKQVKVKTVEGYVKTSRRTQRRKTFSNEYTVAPGGRPHRNDNEREKINGHVQQYRWTFDCEKKTLFTVRILCDGQSYLTDFLF